MKKGDINASETQTRICDVLPSKQADDLSLGAPTSGGEIRAGPAILAGRGKDRGVMQSNTGKRGAYYNTRIYLYIYRIVLNIIRKYRKVVFRPYYNTRRVWRVLRTTMQKSREGWQTVITSVSISKELSAKMKKHKISPSDALRMGARLLLAEKFEGEPTPDALERERERHKVEMEQMYFLVDELRAKVEAERKLRGGNHVM